MADVLFCSKDDVVRKSTILSGSIDSDKIIPAMHLAQTQYLREIIGTDLYNKFSSDITALINSGSTFPADYKNLLDDFGAIGFNILDNGKYTKDALIKYGVIDIDSERH